MARELYKTAGDFPTGGAGTEHVYVIDLTPAEVTGRICRVSVQRNQEPHAIVPWTIVTLAVTFAVIVTFANKGLEAFFVSGNKRGIQPAHARRLERILDFLSRAKTPADMGLPGFHLHPLKGGLEGFFAVRVSGNWRVIFRFENGDAYDVDYVDYH